MSLTLGVVMDPIESITPYKDTTLAMLLAAQARGWRIYCMSQADLYLRAGRTFARMRKLRVYDDNQHWFDDLGERERALDELDIVLMRKDPPFNMNFVYTTYLLERAVAHGALVSNRPGSLRDVNEKLFTAWFSDLCPPTLVTTRTELLKSFIEEHGDVIVKPLDGMGGTGIYRLRIDDPNVNMILEASTQRNSLQIMAQRYVPEIVEGDKRILVVHGEAHPYALARVPAQGETRGNLAAGGRGVPVALTERDRAIVSTVAPTLKERGLHFVGLDVIGPYLTEVNVTSPTCLRELDAHDAQNAQASPPQQTNATATHDDTHRLGIADRYLDGLMALREAAA